LNKITKQISDSLIDTKTFTSTELKDTVNVMDQLKSKVKNDNINSTAQDAQELFKVSHGLNDKTRGPITYTFTVLESLFH